MTDRSVERARSLRRTLTRAETVLWRELRTRPLGAKFRRQHPLGPYVADFCCVELRLIIEIDGGSHFEEDAIAHDEQRTRFLIACGYEVVRFTNDEVLQKTRDVLDQIARTIERHRR